jgi:hypothetical protein
MGHLGSGTYLDPLRASMSSIVTTRASKLARLRRAGALLSFIALGRAGVSGVRVALDLGAGARDPCVSKSRRGAACSSHRSTLIALLFAAMWN